MRTTPYVFKNPLQVLAEEMAKGKKPESLTAEENSLIAQEGIAALEKEILKAKGLEEPKPEAAKETTEPKQPEAPAKSFFEQYKAIIIIVVVLALAIFFWKFKIVRKVAAAAITATA